jgi:hypothetical protein
MIRLEIIDLFLENNRPEIFAKEFYDVEIIRKTRSVSGEAIKPMISQAVLGRWVDSQRGSLQ